MAIRSRFIFLEVSLLLIMNKKTIAVIAISLLIGGISLAALLDYYGIMTGSGEVSAPEFYIGSATNETLLINEKSPDCAHFDLEDSSVRAFKTEGDLEGINFSYIPKVRFSVRAPHITKGVPQDLTLRFGYIGDNGPFTICETNVSMGSEMDNYTTDFIECSATPVGVKKLFYEFKGNCEDCKYIIGKCAGGFYTKVELSK